MRELKNNLSRYLRRVRGGESVRVTMRGRAVADLVPPSEDEPSIERLTALGRITPATKPHSPAPEPIDLGYSLSDRLIADREADDR